MPSRTSVSIVIPCYNAEAFVERAVTSALAQSYPIREIICVNDGSTDGTVAKLEDIKRRLEQVVVLHRTNGGASAARNTGMKFATGDYIQFLDADDELHPDKVAGQVELVEAAEVRPVLVAGAYEMVYPSGGHARVDVEQDPWLGLCLGRLGITSSNLYRREAVLSVGGWDEGWWTSEDPELAFRLLRSGDVVRDNTCRTTLHRRLDSLWNKDHDASSGRWLALRVEMLSWAADNGTLTPPALHIVENKVLSVARRVYRYDPALSLRAVATLTPGFYPDPKAQGRVYSAIYRTLGFTRAEQVYPWWLWVQEKIRSL